MNPYDAAHIDALVEDKKAFIEHIYTPLDRALVELKHRGADPALIALLKKEMGNRIPSAMRKSPKAVLARQLITPNYEVLRFMNVPDGTGLDPLFFEYTKDKLIFENPWKYRLARLSFNMGMGKKGGTKLENVNIINFDKYHGEEIRKAKTLWGESLVSFHHKFFLRRFPKAKKALFDGSSWYAKNGQKPARYYHNFLSLFVAHGILFENFLLDQKEMKFTKEIFLPAFAEVTRKYGRKPLIVALEPTDIEEDHFWISYPSTLKNYVDGKMRVVRR